MTFETGPFLQAALFCTDVIEDTTGVLTLVRIIDKIDVRATGPSAPAELPEGGSIKTKLVLMFKAGSARGKLDLRLVQERPSGLEGPTSEFSVPLPGGAESGANVILDIDLGIEGEGVHWIHVHVNGRQMTRVPMNVTYSYAR